MMKRERERGRERERERKRGVRKGGREGGEKEKRMRKCRSTRKPITIHKYLSCAIKNKSKDHQIL